MPAHLDIGIKVLAAATSGISSSLLRSSHLRRKKRDEAMERNVPRDGLAVHTKTHRQRNVPAAAAAAARCGPQHSHRVLLQEPAGVSMCTYVLVKQVN